MLELDAIAACLSSAPCLVNQATSALISGSLLFLVASGLTLILGVLGVVNFAHGTFYMMGAYFAYTAYGVTNSYTIALISAGAGVAILAALFERLLIERVYSAGLLLQILVCYGFVLVMDDLVKIIWGSGYLSIGVPDALRVPPIRFAGGVIPYFYLFLICASIVIGLMAWLVVERTRFGKIVRAIAHDPKMVACLGIRTPLFYMGLFALGGLMAGLAGGLAAPVRTLSSGMGLSILIESFIVTVVGGMGSLPGAFVASILIGLARSFGSVAMPLFVDGFMFLIMGIVLVIKPEGLFAQSMSRKI